MRFIMKPNDDELVGRTYRDIVRQMADHKMQPVTDLARYREATAARVAELHGLDIDDSSDERFVKSLVGAGLLVRA